MANTAYLLPIIPNMILLATLALVGLFIKSVGNPPGQLRGINFPQPRLWDCRTRHEGKGCLCSPTGSVSVLGEDMHGFLTARSGRIWMAAVWKER